MLAVENDVPHDAHEPYALIADFYKGVAVAQHAQEGLLHGVFSISGITENGKRDPVQSGSVPLHESPKRIFFRVLAGFGLHSAGCDLHPG